MERAGTSPPSSGSSPAGRTFGRRVSSLVNDGGSFTVSLDSFIAEGTPLGCDAEERRGISDRSSPNHLRGRWLTDTTSRSQFGNLGSPRPGPTLTSHRDGDPLSRVTLSPQPRLLTGTHSPSPPPPWRPTNQISWHSCRCPHRPPTWPVLVGGRFYPPP